VQVTTYKNPDDGYEEYYINTLKHLTLMLNTNWHKDTPYIHIGLDNKKNVYIITQYYTFTLIGD
jgi:hypothetical protein